MQKRWSWLIILMIALVPLWGCSDDDDDGPVLPTQTAFEVMAEAGKAYINSAEAPGVLAAATLQANLTDYTVIDIRNIDHYKDGHIPGAWHSTLPTLLADLETTIPKGKPYAIACYSGQSAGHAKIAMELLGYGDVYSLKFGMSAWDPSLSAPWDGNTSDELGNPETTNNNGDLVAGSFPTLTGNPSTIVATQVAAMLTNGFKGKMYSEIRDNLDDYFIINYFGVEDYEGRGGAGVPGHIPGAYQFTPYQSLGDDEMLNTLPTNKPIIVYCWTGQHSSQVTAYLNMLGYEAYSLKFGSNNLFHAALTDHKWTDNAKSDFDLEIGFEPTMAFAELAAAGVAYVNDAADCPGVLAAGTLNDNLSEYTVIDIRAFGDYSAGHIPGAYHSTLATLLTDLEMTIPTGKPYVIACYTGQSAGHAKIAMELMGYENVKSLKFGMASWSLSLKGSWESNCQDELGNPEMTNNNSTLVLEQYPALDGNVATIVEDRVTAMLTNGFKGKMYSDIRDNLSEYFILNYFGVEDYEGRGGSGVPGHIPGAFQYTPYQSMAIGEMLAYLPADMPIIVYCWTGQHSSQVTAYLNMLGYEAYSLKFGSNNLFHQSLTNHNWDTGEENDFTLEPSGTFAVR